MGITILALTLLTGMTTTVCTVPLWLPAFDNHLAEEGVEPNNPYKSKDTVKKISSEEDDILEDFFKGLNESINR